MGYGQVRSSSGRVLNLTPQGWINNEGQNLNDAPLDGQPLNALAQAAMQPQQQQQPAQQGQNRLAQLAQGPQDLSDFLMSQGVTMQNKIDFNGNKNAFLKPDGSVVWQTPDGSIGRAVPRNPEQRAAEKDNLALEIARTGLEKTRAEIDAAKNPKQTLPAGYRMAANGNMEAIPGGPADLKAGAEGIKKEADANDVLSLAGEAEAILPKAHGSGVGNLVGGAANFFGVGNDKNNADAQLKVIAGALVSKMPKMSGPQSDKDVLLYKDMAGQVGDASLPIESRLAALKTVKEINARHATKPSANVPQAPAASVYGDPAKEQRYQAWLKSQGR